jgi:hypothetical protein
MVGWADSSFEKRIRVRSQNCCSILIAADPDRSQGFERVACIDDFGESRDDGLQFSSSYGDRVFHWLFLDAPKAVEISLHGLQAGFI